LELRNNDFDLIDSFGIDRETNRAIDRIIEKCTFPRDKLLHPKNFEMSFDHLETLGLIKLPKIKEDIIRDEHLHVGSKNHFKIHLTKFGEFFVNSCVPENGFRNEQMLIIK